MNYTLTTTMWTDEQSLNAIRKSLANRQIYESRNDNSHHTIIDGKKIDWHDIAFAVGVTEDFVKHNWEELKHYSNAFLCLGNFTGDFFVDRRGDFPVPDQSFWNTVSVRGILSENFIDKHFEQLNWDCLSRNSQLDPKIIETYFDLLDPKALPRNQALTEEMIETHESKIDWNSVSLYFAMTPAFIQRHAHQIDFAYLAINDSVSVETMAQFVDEIVGVGVERLCECIEDKNPYESQMDNLFTVLRRHNPRFYEGLKSYIDEQQSYDQECDDYEFDRY